MEEFYVDIRLPEGVIRVQVDEVPAQQWDIPFTPEFIIEYFNGKDLITLTLVLEQGRWFERGNWLRNNQPQLLGLNAEPDELHFSFIALPSESLIQEIGNAIARHMVVHLTTYMGLFMPAFRNPIVN